MKWVFVKRKMCSTALAFAAANHDRGQCQQAADESRGLWFGHRLHGLHGGEAAIGEDVDVGVEDGCFAVDCEFAQVLVDNLCDRAPRVAINNFGVEIQKVEGGAVE